VAEETPLPRHDEPSWSTDRARAPGRFWYLSDPTRAALEYCLLFTLAPLMPALPRGDGHPVLVLPGLQTSDTSTRTLRHILLMLGYQAYGWRLGRNVGPTAQVVSGLRDRLITLHARHEQPVSLIGWSLGGIYARRLAREHHHAVRLVITLGSPYRLARTDQSRADWLYQRYAPRHAERWSMPLEAGLGPLPVPATSIYSKLDGIVAWQTCHEPPGSRAENIEVYASHFGLSHHPAVLWAVADRLAQPAGQWAPFRPPALLRSAFRPGPGPSPGET
jgi:pimeloyl-ACP methyl ester carboxylesterase